MNKWVLLALASAALLAVAGRKIKGTVLQERILQTMILSGKRHQKLMMQIILCGKRLGKEVGGGRSYNLALHC